MMASILDRVLERESKDAVLRFERGLRQAGMVDEKAKSRVRGADDLSRSSMMADILGKVA
jgi:hypothetical protein